VTGRVGGPMYRAAGRTSRPVRFCSRMWAAQPAVRAQVNIEVNMCAGTWAKSRMIAAQIAVQKKSSIVRSMSEIVRCARHEDVLMR
jgi:hypothetical protein